MGRWNEDPEELIITVGVVGSADVESRIHPLILYVIVVYFRIDLVDRY